MHYNTFLTFCALRSPRSRFLSSIPETLCRLYDIESAETKHPAANVPIPKDVFLFLSKAVKNSGCFIDSFVKAIKEFGFFDAHHEPMVRFLIGENNELEINPFTVDIEHMDVLSKFIFSLAGDESLFPLHRYNENSVNCLQDEPLIERSGFLSAKLFNAKEVISKASGYRRIQQRRANAAQYRLINNLPSHPLNNKILDLENISWRQAKHLIYVEVKKRSKEYPLGSFLESFYSDDFKVFKSLKAAYVEELTPQNLLSSAKRFQDLMD